MSTPKLKKRSLNTTDIRFMKNPYQRQPPLSSKQMSVYCSKQKKYHNKLNSELLQLSFSDSTAFINGKEQEDAVISQKLADFKKYLHDKHDNTVFTSTQTKIRNKNVIRQHQAKINLNNKILEAHRKLEEFKQTVIKHQKVKAEILAKSDMRKTGHSLFAHLKSY